jgi:hypothetical protein
MNHQMHLDRPGLGHFEPSRFSKVRRWARAFYPDPYEEGET